MIDSWATSRLLLAAGETNSFTATEFDVPDSPVTLTLLLIAFLVLVGLTVRLYLKDTREFAVGWKIWLLLLRLSAIAVLTVIFLNPQERTQRQSFRPSRAAIVVDTSLSMNFPEKGQNEAEAAADARSRSDAVLELLEKSDVVQELSRRHAVSIYSFDSTLAGPHRIIGAVNRSDGENPPDESDESSPVDSSLEWSEVVRPRGLETRLGECLQELLQQIGGKTLSGIVVVTDGASNAGVESISAAGVARAGNVRLIPIGVGSTSPPINLMVSGLQAPTDVHIGDGWDLTAFIQAWGLDDEEVQVSLLVRSEGDDNEPTLIESRDITIAGAGVPIPVTFQQTPAVAGAVEYFIRVRPKNRVAELSDDDNERRRTVNIVERPTKVLLVAGGPLRDYRFVRDMIFRHGAMNADVWLQTVESSRATGVSQESERVLTSFPETANELAEYDVIVAFDINWETLSEEQSQMLVDWVSDHAGGLILVAGNVHTPDLASADARMDSVRELYPVYLYPMIADLQLERGNTRPHAPSFTREGMASAFLVLDDGPAASMKSWDEFSGVFRCYPTAGAKNGATVLALFSDPGKKTEHGLPVFMASQFYGSGRTMYVGTAEMWRLRSVSNDYYERFWTRSIREVGQGRLKRGSRRGVLLLERNQYALGQTVRVRAQIYDSQLKPLAAESAVMDVIDPRGRPIVPPPVMLPDGSHPGQFVGGFRAGIEGTWRVDIPIPDTNEKLSGKVEVVLPNLESDNPRQNARLLTDLARDTGGQYLTIADAADKLADLLPDRSQQVMVDERLKTLWDRQWVLYLLVGLLSAEWLTRKLLKLA